MSTYVNNALLLVTLPNLFVPRFLTQVIVDATTQTRNRLVIVFFSRHFNTRSADSLTCPDIKGLSHTKSWGPVQRILTFTYVQATRVAWEANKIQMQVDVLLKGLDEDLDQLEDLGKDMDIVFRVSGGMFGCSFCFTFHSHNTFRFNSSSITRIYLFLKTVLSARWRTKSRRRDYYPIINRLESSSFLSCLHYRRYI